MSVYPLDHELKGTLGIANQAHAVVNTTRTETTLGDLKSSTFTQQYIVDWHTDVGEDHLSMTTCWAQKVVHGK